MQSRNEQDSVRAGVIYATISQALDREEYRLKAEQTTSTLHKLILSEIIQYNRSVIKAILYNSPPAEPSRLMLLFGRLYNGWSIPPQPEYFQKSLEISDNLLLVNFILNENTAQAFKSLEFNRERLSNILINDELQSLSPGLETLDTLENVFLEQTETQLLKNYLITLILTRISADFYPVNITLDITSINLEIIKSIKEKNYRGLDSIIHDPNLRHLYFGFESIISDNGNIYRIAINDDLLSINHYLMSVYDISQMRHFDSERIEKLINPDCRERPVTIPAIPCARESLSPCGSPHSFFSSSSRDSAPMAEHSYRGSLSF